MLKCRGFAVPELVAVVVVTVVLGAMLLVMGDGARRHARIGEDLSNLRQFGTVTQSYGADFGDLFWTFSWRAGESHSQFPDLNNASRDMDAQANQAVDIIRRRSSRVDHPRTTNWMPHLSFSTLVLADYLDKPLPMRMVVSAGDRERQQIQHELMVDRLPFTSSYGMVPVAFSAPASGFHALAQGFNQNVTWVSALGTAFGGVKLSEVAHPSHKVFKYSRHQWHFGNRRPFYAYPEARIPLLTADGSAGVRRTGDANPGWQPRSPEDPAPSVFEYSPSTWWINDPPVPPGESNMVVGHYRWTRGGLLGRDFGGPEVWP